MEKLHSLIHGEHGPRWYLRAGRDSVSAYSGLLDRELPVFAVGSRGDCGTLELLRISLSALGSCVDRVEGLVGVLGWY